MYLRAAKTEAEEAGESTDGMAGSVSELREELLELTGQRVDIQIDEDTFKSTYQILKELSAVWDDLTDVSQANILEMVGGKRNSNVISALLENFTVAEKALQTASNAAGSALAENEKYLDSIAGRISQFQAAWESLSQTIVDSNLVKWIVSLGTTVISTIDNIAQHFSYIDAMLLSVPKILSTFKELKELGRLDGIISKFQNFVGGAKRCPFEYAHYTVVVTLNEP